MSASTNPGGWAACIPVNPLPYWRAGLRVCYCEGTLELMGPGYAHEDTKKRISRLLELYAYLNDVAIYALGSMTYRKKPRKRGAEPDECYYVGKVSKGPPHIVVEVAISRSMSPLLDSNVPRTAIGRSSWQTAATRGDWIPNETTGVRHRHDLSPV